MKISITDASKKLFLAYAKDAGNWAGVPPIGGNVANTKEDRGNLTQLKKAGLITTMQSDGCAWISFTALGREFAKANDVEID